MILLVGCNKYDEGPAISFKSRKNRLKGNYTIVKVERNGTDYTATYFQDSTSFERINIAVEAEAIGTIELFSDTYNTSLGLYVEYNDHYRKILNTTTFGWINSNIFVYGSNWQIERLTNKKMDFEIAYQNDLYKFYLEE